jgi:glycosyltransferase involved in cell wall biosynthesis
MTDPLGQSQVIPYIEGLSAAGYRFTILSCEKPANYLKRSALIRNKLDASGISWEPLFYTKRPPVVSTVYDYLRLRWTARRLVSRKKIRLIHCRSYIAALVGLSLLRRPGVPFIFDMRGFWADERVDAGIWKLSNPVYSAVYRFFKRKEKAFLAGAAAVVSLTYRAKNEMLSWKGIRPELAIDVIPCCVDTALFDPAAIDRNQWRSRYQIAEDEFVVSYLGSIGTWYMLDEMLDFFACVRTRKPNARFLFITQNEHELIRARAAAKAIPADALMIVPAERNDVPGILSISNMSVFFILPAYSKMSSSPTKQGEIMAMGIPVICNSGVGDTDKIVRDYHAGVVLNGFDFSALPDNLLDREFDPAAIRDGAFDYFSLANGVQRYRAIYERILN